VFHPSGTRPFRILLTNETTIYQGGELLRIYDVTNGPDRFWIVLARSNFHTGVRTIALLREIALPTFLTPYHRANPVFPSKQNAEMKP
jgi:hypothetical protein